MKPICLLIREIDSDPAGRRFKLEVADAKLQQREDPDQPEISFATINQLCTALRAAVVVPMYSDLFRLRAALEKHQDFSMEITVETSVRLGFLPQSRPTQDGVLP
jgi:hypothetical protein